MQGARVPGSHPSLFGALSPMMKRKLALGARLNHTAAVAFAGETMELSIKKATVMVRLLFTPSACFRLPFSSLGVGWKEKGVGALACGLLLEPLGAHYQVPGRFQQRRREGEH